MSFRIICFTLHSIGNARVLQHKNHKKSSAEQIPKSKVISIIRVQINKLLVASQRVVSCKPKCCELGVYCELLANKHASCMLASLRVASLQVNNFQSCEQPK